MRLADQLILPDSCSLVYASNGAAYPMSAYTFSSGTFRFASYAAYWKLHMTDQIKLQCTLSTIIVLS